MELLLTILSSSYFLLIWVALSISSLTVLWIDLKLKNPDIMSLMKLVWSLTVLYSGPIGLLIYFYSGRKQIARDSIWRKAFRSVAHCYSGCGAGEIVGVLIVSGLLALGSLWVSVITFILAYIAGFSLTIFPLMQDGESFIQAFRDAVYSETASITVMEIVALGVSILLAQGAKFNDVIFWSSLIVSLTAGLIAAYPVNVLLIKFGFKEGMGSPKM